MNVRRAVELAIQMADAVADAHARGFVHGGLSPDSIVITAKGHAKIPAFELAARGGFERDGGERLHDYDSPEEARGQAPDERSDIYSVGACSTRCSPTRRPMHRGASAPSAVQSESAEGARRRRAEGGRAESGRAAIRARRRWRLSCAASSPMLDRCGVAGEDEELAHGSSTSVAACRAGRSHDCRRGAGAVGLVVV